MSCRPRNDQPYLNWTVFCERPCIVYIQQCGVTRPTRKCVQETGYSMVYKPVLINLIMRPLHNRMVNDFLILAMQVLHSYIGIHT